MRALALILILLNLAFLYWHTQHETTGKSTGPAADARLPPGATRLVLLSERDGAFPPEPIAARSAPTMHCETVGPLTNQAEAEALRDRLERSGVLASLREASREVVSSYWVFLPPLASLDAARDVARTLAGRGLQDLYVISEGERLHGLSLGLFSEHERARRRVAEVERLGFAPQIEARFRTQTVYWLDLAVPTDRLTGLDIPSALGRMDRTCPDS